jgi:hypothetical protein
LIIAPNAFSIRYSSQSDRPPGTKLQAIYDSAPAHLWNRLHCALFVRTTPKGEEYGLDELDPLLWGETKHLLTGSSYQQAIKLLDEFSSLNGAVLIADPLKRAMLQRDLWAIFDWSARFRIIQTGTADFATQTGADYSKHGICFVIFRLFRVSLHSTTTKSDAVRKRLGIAGYGSVRQFAQSTFPGR